MTGVGYFARVWRGMGVRGVGGHGDLLLSMFYVACSLFMLAGVVMSWSRGAWLGLLGAAVVIAFFLPRNGKRGFLLFGIVSGVIAVAWFGGLVPSTIAARVSESTQEFFAFEDVRGIDINPQNYATAERLAHWQAALNMARSNFWLGVGFGNYELAYPEYRLLNWTEPLGHAHNYYLNVLAEVGIIGLLGYGKVWLAIFFMAWRASYHPDNLARFVVLGLLGSWCYLSIHSLFDDLYVNNLFLHLGLMLGILAVLYNQTRSSVRL
jgi:O-antigen ligase